LDNPYKSGKSKPGNNDQQAEQLLLTCFPSGKGNLKYFSDFAPMNFFAKQGMLVNLG